MELAERKTWQLGEGTPALNIYEFDIHALSDSSLSVLTYDGYCEEWADFVLMNRQNRTRTSSHNYDIVIGPIADDAVGYQIRRFISGLIDKQRFLEELKYMKGITMQYFFATEKSLEYLTKLHEL